jgi:hypothetical protein
MQESLHAPYPSVASGRNHLTAAADFHAIWWRQASPECTCAVILPATQACDALRHPAVP